MNIYRMDEQNIVEVFNLFKLIENIKMEKQLFLLGPYKDLDKLIDDYTYNYKDTKDNIITLIESELIDSGRKIRLQFSDLSTEDIVLDLGTILDDEYYMEVRVFDNTIHIILRQWRYARIVRLRRVL